MLGRKQSLREKVLELNVYPKDLAGKNAPNMFRIYVVTKHKKKVDVLIMEGLKFLGYRTLKSSKTFPMCDIQQGDIHNVYRYKSDHSYNLALLKKSGLRVEYKARVDLYSLCSLRNEEERTFEKITRTRPIDNEVTYIEEHKQLIDFIKKHNQPITKTS